MRWHAPLLAAAAAAAVAVIAVAPGAGGFPRAAAAPTIDIRAQSRLALERVRLLGDGNVEVHGTLVDALTGAGLPRQRVRIRVGPADDAASAGATTDDEGKFVAVLRGAPPGAQPIELSYAGGDAIEAAAPYAGTTDPARAQVALALTAREAPAGAELTVTATVEDAPVELPIQLEVGPVTGALAPLATTRSGAAYTLERARAGGPGTVRVRAAFAGDDVRLPASAELTVELASPTTTTLDVAATSLAYEDDLVATGAVTDRDGRPVARAAVTLAAAAATGDRRLAQGVTGPDGRYRLEVEAEVLGEGQLPIKVHADPGTPAVRPSDSPPVVVTVAAPQPVPVSYTVAAFLATALAAGGFFAGRSKPWRRLRRPAAPAEAPAAGAPEEQADGGLVLNKPGLVSTLRRAYDDGFDGVVRDTVRGRPVPGAVLRLHLPDGARDAETGPEGAFAFEALPQGEWRAEVAAAGHVTERFAVSIPHRGELRGVRVDLVPVRERVFQLYRRAAEPLLPEARLWGIWSPRQIVDHVRAGRPSPALAALTDFVEEVYFSGRLPAEALLPDAAERVDHAIREHAIREHAIRERAIRERAAPAGASPPGG